MGLGLMLSVSLPSAACLTVVAASLGTLFPSYDNAVLSSSAGGTYVVVNTLCLLSSTNLLGNDGECVVCNKLGVREVRWPFWLKWTSSRLIRIMHEESCIKKFSPPTHPSSVIFSVRHGANVGLRLASAAFSQQCYGMLSQVVAHATWHIS